MKWPFVLSSVDPGIVWKAGYHVDKTKFKDGILQYRYALFYKTRFPEVLAKNTTFRSLELTGEFTKWFKFTSLLTQDSLLNALNLQVF